MAHVSFQPDGRQVETTAGETLLAAALRQGIPHYHVCGGQGRCSTCRVLVTEGLERCSPRTPAEEDLGAQMHLTAPVRLACQTRVAGPVALRRLVLDPDDVRLAASDKTASGPVGEERVLAVLFADLADFTRFSERAPAYDVVHVLNRWFDGAFRAIEDEGGRLDNTMGDGLLAVFGMCGEPDAALRGVRAGVRLLQVAEALCTYAAGLFGWEVAVRIGLHVGPVVVGAIGPAHARRTTVIGDAVNYASRIETANKAAGTRFLVSEPVHAAVAAHVETRGPIEVELKGKTGRHLLYEVLGLKP